MYIMTLKLHLLPYTIYQEIYILHECQLRVVPSDTCTAWFSPVVSTRCLLETVRVGVKIPQDGNRTNWYGHVATVHEHVWRTLCSVCATGARVARPVPCNS